MVVYKPMNYQNIDNDMTTNTDSNTNSNTNIDDIDIDTNTNTENSNSNCNCNHNHSHGHSNSHGHNCCPCPCPKPDEVNITISVDECPCDISTDVIYGPPGRPGKDGKINGYNEVEIVGGTNVDVVTDRNVITINATPGASETYVEDINADICQCDCEACHEFEQAKPSSKWYIKHNLNKYPSVTVVEGSNRVGKVIICEVEYLSKNEVNLRFNGRFRGTAYLN